METPKKSFSVFPNSVDNTLLYNNSYIFLDYNIQILKNELKKTKKKFKNQDDELIETVEEAISLEIICKTMQYAEYFAAFILSSDEGNYNKFMLNYATSDIVNFYEKTPDRDLKYFLKILGPYNFEITNGVVEKYRDSLQFQKEFFIKLSKFYLSFKDLYNSTKHGYRILYGRMSNKDETTFSKIDTAYFSDRDSTVKGRRINCKDYVDQMDELHVYMTEFCIKLLDNLKKLEGLEPGDSATLNLPFKQFS